MPALGPLGPLGPQSPYARNPAHPPQPSPTYGPRGGLPGLNGQPWKQPDGSVGYARAYAPPQEEVPTSFDPFAEADEAQAEYMRLFQENLNKSRQNIQSQYATALADISASEGRATQAVQQLPPMLQSIYGGTASEIDAQGVASKASQAATGLQSFTPAGAGVEPIKAAVAGEFASRQADVPLLQLGAQQSFATQRSGLGQAQQRALGDVEAQGNEGLMQSYRDEAAQKRELASAYQQRQWSQDDALRDRQWQLEDMGLEKKNKKGKAAEDFRAQVPEPPDKSSAEYASWLSHARPKEYEKLKDSAAFRYATKSMRDGLSVADPEPKGFGGLVGASAALNVRPGGALYGELGPGRNSDNNYGGGSSRQRLSLRDLVKKYKGNPRLVGLLKLAYGNNG